MKRIGLAIVSLCSMSVGLLAGCGGFGGVSLPDTVITEEVPLGTIQGNNFGGHAPLVGAHVYVLQASTSGIGTAAVSKLGATTQSSTVSYPTTQNASDPGVPTSAYYVTTDANGAFNISGNYSCTAGVPVWLYGYGGTPTTSSLTGALPVATINVLTAGSPATVQFTVTIAETLTAGSIVQLSGFTGAYAGLNNQSAAVLSAGLTTLTFELSGLTGISGVAAGVATATGSATPNTAFNPYAVNLAMLGNCPQSGNFQNTLNYVYMNEVSTIAMAYAMAGFGSDGAHVGSSGSTVAAQGIANAAVNAANLYDIQGRYLTTFVYGEGHIANPTTFAGSNNGTVPQAELDTLGNILATCVDSNNSVGGTESPQCVTVLFAASNTGGLPPGYNASTYANNGTALPSCTATSGIGIAAINTAQAAFNIAHFPQTPCVTGLYTVSTGTVPFTPNLTSTQAGQPNDFTVGITYNSTTASGQASIASPVDVQFDANGNAYIANGTAASYVTEFSPAGVVLAPTASAAVPTLGASMDSLAIDPSGYVWVTLPGSNIGNQVSTQNNQLGNGVLAKYTNVGATAPGLAAVTTVQSQLGGPESVAIDSAGTVFISQCSFFNTQGSYYIAKYSGGTLSEVSVGGDQCPEAIAVGSGSGTEYIYVQYDANAYIDVTPGGATGGSATNLSNNYNLALDSAGNGWVATESSTNVYKAPATGGATAYGKGTGNNGQNSFVAGLYQPTWTAVDGAGNVYIVNNNGTNSSVSKLSNSGFALSCPTCLNSSGTAYGYQKGTIAAQSTMSVNGVAIHVGKPAVDSSGDLWIPNYSTNTVLEIIGVGTPVVTPLSANKQGVTP